MRQLLEELYTPVCGKYDVIVLGGGVAGVSAALAAARGGAKTLLIEKQAVLGGLATAGHVNIYLPLCDGCGNKVIAGIAEELLLAAIAYGYDTLPEAWQGKPMHADTTQRYRTEFNVPAFAFVLEQKLVQAGVKLLLDTMFCAADVQKEEERVRVRYVVVENKSGRQAYYACCFIDATGDADLFFNVGATCNKQKNHLAYWSYYFHPEAQPTAKPKQARGTLHMFMVGDDRGGGVPEGSRKYDGTNAEDVTAFLLDSHALAFQRLEEKNPPMFASFPSMPQFRTTRSIVGAYTLTQADVGKPMEAAVGIAGDWRQANRTLEIPYGALFSNTVCNAFAAGRNIAATGDAWEITRVIPVAALTGEIAGTAASLCVQTQVDARDLSVSALRRLIADMGGIVPQVRNKAGHPFD